MLDEKILYIITSELTGQATKKDLEILHHWKDKSRENASLYYNYKEAFIDGKYMIKAKEADKAFNRLIQKIER